MLPWGTCDSKVLKGGTFTALFRNLDGFRGLYTETRLGPSDSDPDQGSRRSLHISGIQPRGNSHGLLVKGRERPGGKLPERFSQRQKKPDPGQALRPFLRSCLFSSRSHRDCSVRDPPSGIAKSRGDRSALAQPGSHTIQTRGLNRSLIRLRDPIKDPTDV